MKAVPHPTLPHHPTYSYILLPTLSYAHLLPPVGTSAHPVLTVPRVVRRRPFALQVATSQRLELPIPGTYLLPTPHSPPLTVTHYHSSPLTTTPTPLHASSVTHRYSPPLITTPTPAHASSAKLDSTRT